MNIIYGEKEVEFLIRVVRVIKGQVKHRECCLGLVSLENRSVSGTSGGRRITNTRGPLSDVIEAAATIIHNLRFTKPIACDPNSRTRSVARFVFMVFTFESGPCRQFFFKC